MKNKYEVKQILEAVNEILNKSNEISTKKLNTFEEKPLTLVDEVKSTRNETILCFIDR